MDLPTVSLNFAITADGKISSIDRRPSDWTSRDDFERLLALRLEADALLVGRGTLAADSMTMTIPARLKPARQPLRCVVSRSGAFDPGHPLFQTPGGDIHLLLTDPENHPPPNLPGDPTIHRDSLPDFLATLHREHRVKNLHCEGGGELARSLFELDLVDSIHLTWAGHHLFGGRNAPTLTGLPGDFLPASRQFHLDHFDPRPDLGECFLSYRK